MMDLRREFEKNHPIPAKLTNMPNERHFSPEYVEWLEQRLKAGQHETIVMLPYLLNRADAVDGHYCIARKHPDGYTEFWNDELKKWCSSASVFELGTAT